ncbi:1-acyl-sn-glycerol-3-phosphate acyltransferase [Corynebacterium sp. sy017]|uniref:lysophospholipid acyltransferase family protein n=1 Tax=unclassified Corynebacterium TaxID=2624378 RepID=UPI0011846C57|nr:MULTISPECIES: lysophospholipid acyltransferase family protein [unclassified Corynebacterium]MBP3087981.1 1-acyl-sn-glycerol-3-phosphate acyltransferase [Corynebacterium sp. sy017]QDZ42937.1 1-acyl-sn-glycerol-3-phosphate acyltransferase [Corynebacterium sp. sy039]TSD92511.1 1-acyl-sn-glycerol-3-phosphate acyltransferase [Corynebacterium sp. SY003]
MQNKLYWFLKHIVVGPLLHIYNRPTMEGKEKIPAHGSAILVSNHQAVMDSFYLPLLCPRQIIFPAKKEYFTTPGVVGAIQKWFFSGVGQVPLDRSASDAGQALLEAAQDVLNKGELFGIYPEGTRSPDGRLYKGKTGIARVALTTGDKIIPVAMFGTREVNPIGSWIPRPRKVHIKVGDPIDPHEYVRNAGVDPNSYEAIRGLTDHFMAALAKLSGQTYVDVYAADVKKSLEAGQGYPEEAQP